jgi:CRISPR-associated endonuclease/helicase Cas3
MYFNYSTKIDIKDFINKNYKIFAHKKEGEKETLEEHTDLVIKYFVKIINEKHMIKVFEEIEKAFFKNTSLEAIELFKEMILNAIILHDIGKVNLFFQKSKLDNDLKIKGCGIYKNSHHSMLSAIIYINIYVFRINEFETKEKSILLDFMMMNAYIISRHHGGLSSWKDFKKKFEEDEEGYKLIDEQRVLFEKTLNININITINIVKKIFRIIEEYTKKYSKELLVYRYIYERLMLSILTACDFYSTSQFMDGVEIKEFGVINDIDEFYNVFQKGEIYKSIRNYEEKEYGKEKKFVNIKDINILRNELFLDSEKMLVENITSDIFYLEAPTGSGKSNVATNLSFKLLQEDKTKNKIIYVYPFNTLVEQNINNLQKIFHKENNILNKIAVINSIEPIKIDKEIIKTEYTNEDTNIEYYKNALLNRQFLNYPMMLTTHVTFFKYLFGTSREDTFPLHQFANSVIVLDEIQSYKNLIWGEIITFLSCYTKVLNIKIIIMSATLPNLDNLCFSRNNTIRLIENRNKYFQNPIFKNRVKVDYSLLESDNILDALYNHVKEKSILRKKILIEFISKNSAYNFYNRLKEDEEILCDVELMSGDDSIGERDRIINKAKSNNALILVATQVVEAGVDIDMDIGYKNISMLDSEEQFLGRINRSCEKEGCTVYFFKLDEAKNIYKNDIRVNNDITLENANIKEVLKRKDFSTFYDLVIERLKDLTTRFNDLNIEEFFNNNVKDLEFRIIADRLKLIKEQDNKISVYLSSNLIVKGNELDGTALWYEYKRLLMKDTMDYSERKVKLSEIRAKMNNFIYEIKWNYDFPYNDRLGDLYFIEDGDKYFKEGKLDKEKFISGIGDFI